MIIDYKSKINIFFVLSWHFIYIYNSNKEWTNNKLFFVLIIIIIFLIINEIYTHNWSNRKERDKFINELFDSVGIKLYRVKVANNYNMQILKEKLKEAL